MISGEGGETSGDLLHGGKVQEEEERLLAHEEGPQNDAILQQKMTVQSDLHAKKQDFPVSNNGRQRQRRLSWADMTPSDDDSNGQSDSDDEESTCSRIQANNAGSSQLDYTKKNSLLLSRTRPPPSPRSNDFTTQTQSITARTSRRRSTSDEMRDSFYNGSDPSNRQSLLSKASMGCIQDDTDKAILEEKKSNAIWCLRTLTITTLTAAAVVVAALTFTFSRNSEYRVFEIQYLDSVAKVSEAIKLAINNKLNTAMTFSAVYTSRYQGQDKWPNITLPHFGDQAEGLLEVAEGIALSFNPIITNTTRDEWEVYATESAHMIGEEKLTNRSCDECRIVGDGIFRKTDGVVVDDPGYSPESRYPYHMVPVWQIYPTAQNWKAVMFNLHSEMHRQHALDDMLQYKVATITGLLHLVQHVEMNPSSILFYPVLSQFHESRLFQEVVGSISIVFTWADIFRSVLPGYIKGLIVVLESVADEVNPQSFTYSIWGEQVTLLGEGDLHDPRFDSYEHQVNASVAQDAQDLGIVDYLVTYRIRIYPSLTFQNQYLTVRPLAMTFTVIAMFVLTSTIFLLYDYLVHVRQNAVVKFAQRSGRIVDSLFPSGVRDRLFSQADHMGTQTLTDKDNAHSESPSHLTSGTSSRRKNPAHHIKQFLKGNFQKSVSENEQSEGYIQNSPPIADLFHNTTIMFADIVTFTEWSANNSPEDVFYLLETLFLEFDKVAERLGVFKLGTIGDCYVAVVGVPDARKDHAVVLAKFAEECRCKTNRILSELIDELGPSVGKLSMRFGLHSGSVTAGVLRGLKSRFELFGDTINTASRMESTGAPNMIQVSEETATILKNEGYESWLRPREDLVHAKGKGLLQTYWLEINKDDSSLDCQRGNFRSPQKSEIHIHDKSNFVHNIKSKSSSDLKNENDNSKRIDNKGNDGPSFDEKIDDDISMDSESEAILSRSSSSSSIFDD